jgi:ABC-type antimicrobial peptide transport system permease subunit
LLLGGFAVLAALLAAAGLYGLLSLAVTQRLREMGVRVALGATREQVVGEVVRWAAVPVVVGLSVGLPLALASGTVLDRLLPGLTGPSPASLAGATAALAVTALLAVAHPALRAGRAADPLALLKD